MKCNLYRKTHITIFKHICFLVVAIMSELLKVEEPRAYCWWRLFSTKQVTVFLFLHRFPPSQLKDYCTCRSAGSSSVVCYRPKNKKNRNSACVLSETTCNLCKTRSPPRRPLLRLFTQLAVHWKTLSKSIRFEKHNEAWGAASPLALMMRGGQAICHLCGLKVYKVEIKLLGFLVKSGRTCSHNLLPSQSSYLELRC